jgi:hypothetical protein
MKNIQEKIKSVYTAHSKHYFYARKMISAYVLKENALPLNPFTNWDYFMNDMVDRKLTVRANNSLIMISDELWQFGIISNGCYHEIKLAMELNKKIRFFTLGKYLEDIKEITTNDIEFEEELKNEYDTKKFLAELNEYVKYPFLEGKFWELLLKQYPDLASLLDKLGIRENKGEIVKILDRNVNEIFREGNEDMSELAIKLASLKFAYKDLIGMIKSKGKQAIDVGAYEDVPIELVKITLSSILYSYTEMMMLDELSEEKILFNQAYPYFEIAVKGYGIIEDKNLINKAFIRRWFRLEYRKDTVKEYDQMIEYFTNRGDMEMLKIVNLEYDSFCEDLAVQKRLD